MLTKNEIISKLEEITLPPTRTVMVHSSYNSLGWVEGGPNTVIDAILEWVGPEGTALFVTYDFEQWPHEHYHDVNESESKMGIIGEIARKRKESIRTPHPMLSFAAFGKDKYKYAGCDDPHSYGHDSVFGLFHRNNGVMIGIGLRVERTFSMAHYVEYHVGCDYRRTKEFSGIYVDACGQPSLRTYSMFVRNDSSVQNNIKKGMSTLYHNGIIKTFTVGEAVIHYTNAKDFFDNLAVVIREHPERMYHKITYR